ncbi:MAG: Hpt domain-containing protein [Candidatus Methylacidiphilales bacterium]|nr:Hpt domain-containing protein [Candidatus Methylacidiphilales bacterium]
MAPKPGNPPRLRPEPGTRTMAAHDPKKHAPAVRPVPVSAPGPALRRAAGPRRPPSGLKLQLGVPLAPTTPEPEPDYQSLFRAEVVESVGVLDRALAAWPSTDSIANLVRVFHTLHGSARTLDITGVAAISGRLEQTARDLEAGILQPSDALGRVFREGCVELARWAGLDPSQLSETPLIQPMATPIAPLGDALREMEAWIGQDHAAAERLCRILEAQSAAPEAEVPTALKKSFGLLLDYLRDWGPSPPPAPMQAVLRRCLGDATGYLAVPPGERTPWRRRWGLYFNSLRVAMASERKSSVVPSGPAPDPEMVQAFIEEAQSLFDSVEQALLRWEKGENPKACRSELRRHFHTLKGAANSVGLAPLGSAYHDWEERMDQAEAPAAPPGDLLPFNDRVRGYLAALAIDPSTPWAGLPVAPVAEVVDAELLEAFLEEARQLLEPIETSLLAWERGEEAAARQAELRRHFHTLKGAANSVGLRALGADFHVLEERMQQNVGEAERVRWIPLVLACMDETRTYLVALATDAASPWQGGWEARFQNGTASPAASATAASSEKTAVRVEAERVRQLLDQSGELVAGLSRTESYFDEMAALRRRLDDLSEQMVRELEMVQAGRPSGAAVLLEWEKACASVSSDLARMGRSFGASQNAVLQRGRTLQKDLAGLNMGPVSGLFRRLQRVFRDALQEEAKQASLVTEGGQTRLDRSVLERLYGPLLHIVRNAVAHGIEKPGTRTALGKHAEGLVKLSAQPFSDHVRIEVADDGAGIDGEAVRRRAIQRGLLPADAPALPDEEVIRILFMPGFTTKETVSSVAGRGVGLDVVKEEIESMNGSVSVRFTAGAGAVWTIRVPLNLSASEALLVRAGDIKVALPLSYIVRCHLLHGEDFESRNGRLVLAASGLPYFALHEVLGSSAGEDPTHGIEVDGGSSRAVFGVHAILTRREVVSLDPGPLLRRLPVLSGVAPDSDGTLLPLLQVPLMLRRLAGGEIGQAGSLAVPPLRVLVVDDSSSVRLAHRLLLEKIGWQVELSPDAEAALTRVKAGGIDLVLTDLEMPGQDGRGLLRAIRADPALAAIPVLMVTSRREDRTVSAILGEGAAACLSKPLDIGQVVAAVSRLEPWNQNP